MSVYFQGMTAKETATLTKEMVNSGNTFKWPKEWKGLLVDKHSTGGVGDKISLPLAPALAANGLKVITSAHNRKYKCCQPLRLYVSKIMPKSQSSTCL